MCLKTTVPRPLSTKRAATGHQLLIHERQVQHGPEAPSHQTNIPGRHQTIPNAPPPDPPNPRPRVCCWPLQPIDFGFQPTFVYDANLMQNVEVTGCISSLPPRVKALILALRLRCAPYELHPYDIFEGGSSQVLFIEPSMELLANGRPA